MKTVEKDQLTFFDKEISFWKIDKEKQPKSDSKKEKENDSESTYFHDVIKIMRECNFMPNLSGYKYMRDSIIYILKERKNGNYEISTSKCVFKDVSKKYHSTTARVERAIRNVIEQSWKKYKTNNLLLEWFYEKPTTSQVLFMIVELVESSYI